MVAQDAFASSAERQRTTVRGSSAPFKLTGNVNRTRTRLFSPFDYTPDPLPIVAPVRRIASVNPFSTTTLPYSPSTPYFQPRLIPAASPSPSRPTPPWHHHGLTALRARSFPSHSPSAPAKALSLSYEREVRWVKEPHVEKSAVDLYRTLRQDPEDNRRWRASNNTGRLFSCARADDVPTEPRAATQRSTTSGGAQHAEGWRGGGSNREGSERGQMAGRVERYHVSPFERSEAVRSKLAPESLRTGYRVDCNHLHFPVRIGSGTANRSDSRFHSRRSADGRCRHNCQRGEE